MATQEIVTTGGENAAPIVQWDPNSGEALPAYLAEAQGELGTNIPDRQTVPSLTIEGKIWTIVKDGNKTKLQAPNGDGDLVPVPIMRVVILDINPDRGRAYYPGTYNPAASTQPLCWSADGLAPDPSVKEKQSPLCKDCPMSVKGSKVAEGREMVACGSHRMIAVAPAFDLEMDPLRLKLPVTSDWDKEIVEHGWFALRQYLDFLKSRGVTHSGLVVTKMKFDSNTAYPKVLFSLDRVLTPNELVQVKEALKNPKVAEILAEKWTPAGTAGTPIDDSDMAPQPDLQETTPVGHVPPQPDTLPVRPKPDNPAFIHAEGTDTEMWWDVTAGEKGAWVKPWVAATPAPPPPPPEPMPISGLEAAVAAGWTPHPDAPGYHYLDQEVVADGELAARFPPAAADGGVATTSAPETPAAPPASPSEPAPLSGLEAALADGWKPHPEAPGYHYREQEVVADGDLAGRYPSGAVPAASAATSGAGSTAATSGQAAPATAGSGQTATTAASPSDAAVDPSVQALLDKWTS